MHQLCPRDDISVILSFHVMVDIYITFTYTLLHQKKKMWWLTYYRSILTELMIKSVVPLIFLAFFEIYLFSYCFLG